MGIKNYAQEAFRSDSTDGTLLFTPVPKFRFEVVMSVKNFDIDAIEDITLNRIKSITIPDVSFETVVANQYNKKRIVQTSMNIGDCTISFYDTNDNWFSKKIFMPYVAHYYNSTKGIRTFDSTANPFIQESDNIVISDTFNTDMGYTLVSSSNRYKIPKLVIYTGGISNSASHVDIPNEKRATVLRNCMIKSIQQESLDYSDSNAIMYNVTLQPEFIYVANDQTKSIEFWNNA